MLTLTDTNILSVNNTLNYESKSMISFNGPNRELKADIAFIIEGSINSHVSRVTEITRNEIPVQITPKG